MRIDDIQEEWDQDSGIDANALDTDSVNISKLHSKYYKIYFHEAVHYKKMEQEQKVLRFEKYEFYTLGETEDSRAKGWKFPAQGRILKNEVQLYIDADKDIVNSNLKLALQKEKVDFVESIIKMIANRNFHLKVALDFLKFKNGL